MKNALILLPLILFVLNACKTSENTAIDKNLVSNERLVEVKVLIEDNVSFQINNVSSEIIYLIRPRELYIEKFENGSWKKLQILPCPCGAPCAKPSNQMEIPSNMSFSLKWNKEESWCGKRNEKGIPNTETRLCAEGAYRLKIVIKTEQSENRVIYKEFEI